MAPASFLLSENEIMELGQSLSSPVPAVLLVGTSWAFCCNLGGQDRVAAWEQLLVCAAKGVTGQNLRQPSALCYPVAQTVGENLSCHFSAFLQELTCSWRCQRRGHASPNGNSTELTSFLLGNLQVCHKSAQALGGSRNLLLD